MIADVGDGFLVVLSCVVVSASDPCGIVEDDCGVGDFLVE